MVDIILSPVQMTSLEISELVESRHDTTKDSIKRLINRGVINSPVMTDIPYVDESGRKRTTSAYVFSGEKGKRDSIVVVAQLSPEFTARLVDRWQALETGEATPVYMAEAANSKREHVKSQLAAKMVIARAAKSMLRMSETSTIRMLAKIAESEGLPTDFLPAYVNETLTKAMTQMLKDLNHPLASKVRSVVHPALEAMGILEHLSRPSSSKPNETRQFWSLTEEGQKYGRNETSPNNPRETQPLYFVDRFGELLERIEAYVDAHPKGKSNGAGDQAGMLQ